MRQSKLKLAAAAAIVLAVSFCAGLSITRTIYREEVKSGGVDFSLIAVIPGTNACFPGGPLDKLFQRFFPGKSLSIGPLKFAPVLPLTHISHYVEDGRVFAPNQATIWLRSKGGRFPVPEKIWFQDIRATIADERGEEWEMCPGQSALFPQSGKNWNEISEISAWHFPSFPRRGRRIRFKLYSRDTSDHWNLLAEFNGVNPAPGPYPVWKEPALPLTVTNHNMSVSLVKLVSGSKSVRYLGGAKRAFTKATFRVEQNGRQTTGWLPQWMDATDATRNEGSFQTIDHGATNGLVFCDAQAGGLSPSEVWRLKMKFKQVGDFPDGRVWTSPDLLVNDGLLLPANLSGHYPGSYPNIHLTCSGSSIRVKMDRLPPGWQLTLVGMVDDQGVERRQLRQGSFDDDTFEVFPKIEPGVRWVRVTVAASEVRSFEFLARPTRE